MTTDTELLSRITVRPDVTGHEDRADLAIFSALHACL